MSAPDSLTIFQAGNFVKTFHKDSGVEHLRVIEVSNKYGKRHYTFLSADGTISPPTHNENKTYVHSSVSDEVYLLYRFTRIPPCEFGNGCCPGSGCCFRSGEVFNLAVSKDLTASYAASFWASKYACISSFKDTLSDEVYFSD